MGRFKSSPIEETGRRSKSLNYKIMLTVDNGGADKSIQIFTHWINLVSGSKSHYKINLTQKLYENWDLKW